MPGDHRRHEPRQQQANAQQYYQQQMGAALLIYADKLEAFVGVLQTEGVTDTQITVADEMDCDDRVQSLFRNSVPAAGTTVLALMPAAGS